MKNRRSVRKAFASRPDGLVFAWKGLDGSQLPKWMAVGIVGAAFMFCVGAFRVQVVRPSPWIERKASVIHVPPGPEGRRWALQAREGGPFPSRFEPAESPGSAAMEELLQTTLRVPAERHVPTLRDLPDHGPLPQVRLSHVGKQVFPEREPPPRVIRSGGAVHTTPVLYPLAGLTQEQLPAELPPFEPGGDGAPANVPWRFLLRLHPDGTVAESVSLVGPEAVGLEALESWLRKVKFHDEPGALSRWISVGVGFINRPIDGADRR